MAENNKNRNWNRGQHQQWNDSNRSNRDYNEDREYNDSNRYGGSGYGRNEYSGGNSGWSGRYEDEGYDRNRNQRNSNTQSGYYGNQGNRYWSDNRDNASNRNRENDYERNLGSSWGSSDSSNFGSSYQNDYPDYEDYARGSYGNTGEGYRNYGGSYGNRSGFSGNRFGSGNDHNRGRQSTRYAQQDSWPYGYGTQGSTYGTNYESQQGEQRGWWDKTTDEVSSWFGNEEAERRREQDHRREGYHRGKGPKGYQRSDERIKDDINDRLSDDPFVDASEIDVTVQNGEVTLTGTVKNRGDKRRSEDLAEAVSGVKNVEVRLRVQDERYDTGLGRSSYVSNSAVTGTTSSTADKNKLKQSSLTDSK